MKSLYADCPDWVKAELPLHHPNDEYDGDGFRTVEWKDDKIISDTWHHSSVDIVEVIRDGKKYYKPIFKKTPCYTCNKKNCEIKHYDNI